MAFEIPSLGCMALEKTAQTIAEAKMPNNRFSIAVFVSIEKPS